MKTYLYRGTVIWKSRVTSSDFTVTALFTRQFTHKMAFQIQSQISHPPQHNEPSHLLTHLQFGAQIRTPVLTDDRLRASIHSQSLIGARN